MSMLSTLTSQLRPAVSVFALLTVVTGLAYPYAVNGIAQATFPAEAAGSLIERDGKLVGSTLVGQHFTDPGHF